MGINTYSLPEATAYLLREKAEKTGCGRSTLLDLCIRFALARMSDEALQDWWQKAKRSDPARKFLRSEKNAMFALHTEWQEFRRIRVRTTQGEAVHYRALQALATLGLAERNAFPPDATVQHFTNGVPAQSFWRLTEAGAETRRVLHPDLPLVQVVPEEVLIARERAKAAEPSYDPIGQE